MNIKKTQKKSKHGRRNFDLFIFLHLLIFFRNMSKMLNDLILRFTVELK